MNQKGVSGQRQGQNRTHLIIVLLIHGVEGFNDKIRPNISTLIDLKCILHGQPIGE